MADKQCEICDREIIRHESVPPMPYANPQAAAVSNRERQRRFRDRRRDQAAGMG